MGHWTRGAAAALTVVGTASGSAAPAVAQEEEPIPTIPAGVPAVILPVQATVPTAGGAWLGGARTDREALGLLDAELAFALREEEGAASWALPEEVRARLERNPMLRVDPRHLAYHGLIREPERHEQIYEPLHGQLRQIAALFDARILVLPLRVWYRGPTDEERRAAGEGEEPLGRAVMLTAVIDIRRSAVLWHGRIEGGPGEATSRGVLTTLALRAADRLAPS